jgi:hypothetical protein
MSLLDPKWKYVHSSATDVRKTFAKARRDLAQARRIDARPPKLQLMSAAVPTMARAANRVQQQRSARSAPKLEEGITERRNTDFSTHVTSRWERSA